MTRPFPLYAKILTWFFLNLLLLGAAGYGFVRAQFRFGPDFLLAGGAGERIQAVADLIDFELKERPQPEWDAVLKRVSDAYQVQFVLFRNDGAQLAGESRRLPSPVLARITEFRGPMGSMGRGFGPRFGAGRFRERAGPGSGPGSGPGPDREMAPGPEPGVPRVLPKLVVRTTDPTQYWVLVRLFLPDAERPRHVPATLVLISASLSGGGLFFDVKPWVAVGAGAVVFSLLFWLPLVRGITRSLGQMTHATRQIAEGRFAVRVDERRRDELGSLGQSINQMAQRLHGFVTGQKRFLGDIAHELCSPLARLRVALGILDQRAADKEQTYVQVASDKAEHMARLVNELLSFSKASMASPPLQLQVVPLRPVVEKAVAREADEGPPVAVAVPEGLAVQAEPELLVRALANLLRNARRYAGQAGPISITASGTAEHLTLIVADSGPGIPEADLTKVFDPFYRVDTSRDRATGGVGLGLSIVKTCVESCQGTVFCRNRQPQGLEVVIRLPAAVDQKG